MRQNEVAATRGPHPPLGWWSALVVFVLVVVIQGAVLAIVLALVQMTRESLSTEDASGPWLFPITNIARNGIILLILLLALRLQKQPARLALRLTRPSIRAGALIVIMTLALAPWEGIWGHNGADGVETVTEKMPTSPPQIVAWVLLLVLTPVAEEALFRGYLLSALGARSGALGVLGSCVLFGLYHYSGSASAVMASLPFGLVLACGVLVSRSLYPAIAAHSAYNALAAAMDLGDLSMHPTTPLFVGSAVVLVICTVALLRGARPWPK